MWAFLLILAIFILAFFIRKATKGTAFAHKCPCTPYIEHLRPIEQKGEGQKKEDLW